MESENRAYDDNMRWMARSLSTLVSTKATRRGVIDNISHTPRLTS